MADALDRVTDGSYRPVRADANETDQEAQERKREKARVLWAGSQRAEDLTRRYLTSRGIGHIVDRPVIRFRDDVTHPAERGRHAAMLALVTDMNDAPLAVHRTYLDRDTSRKASIEPAKASLGPIWGGAIRLDPWVPPSDALVIGEGIETAASAGLMMGLPAWAAVSAGNLERGLMLPPEVHSVIIAADTGLAGERAARAASDRWLAEGRSVKIAWPDPPGDFNDVLMRREVPHGRR